MIATVNNIFSKIVAINIVNSTKLILVFYLFFMYLRVSYRLVKLVDVDYGFS